MENGYRGRNVLVDLHGKVFCSKCNNYFNKTVGGDSSNLEMVCKATRKLRWDHKHHYFEYLSPEVKNADNNCENFTAIPTGEDQVYHEDAPGKVMCCECKSLKRKKFDSCSPFDCTIGKHVHRNALETYNSHFDPYIRNRYNNCKDFKEKINWKMLPFRLLWFCFTGSYSFTNKKGV